MKEKMERPIFNRNSDPNSQGSTLVVGIDKKGNIIRFNDTLEQLTGSEKKDVINVPFSSYFSKQIPEEELQKLITQARFNPENVDVDTSFQTVSGDNVLISWTGFPIKNQNDGMVSQLNLVGTPQKQYSAKTSMKSKKEDSSIRSSTQNNKSNKSAKKTFKPNKKKASETKNVSNRYNHVAKNNESSSESNKTSSSRKEKESKKDSNKENKKKKSKHKKTKSKDSKKKKSSKRKIRIRRKTKKSNKKKETSTNLPNQEDQSSKSSSESLISKRFLKPVISRNKTYEKSNTSPKISLFTKKLKKSEYTEDGKSDRKIEKSLRKKIKQLQKENEQLQKQNGKLEKNIESAELKKEKIKGFFNEKFRFIRDSVGIKKKREEFHQMMHQLNQRKQRLEQLETDMVLEKKEFKQKIEEFISWREKLERLEQEIEKRRQFLSDQENYLNQQYDKVLSHELTQPANYTKASDEKESNEKDRIDDQGILEKDDLFNSLSVEAAVLQRGRIKKANKLFANMLGYSEDELIGKHLVDFVGPNGLSGVEQHYMNRLKGVDDASYQTVFLSKSEDEIPVKVHVKNGDFQGERAEIATFNEI